MYLYRQISALLTRNSVETIAEAPPGPKNRLTHALQTLVVNEGKHLADAGSLAAAGSLQLQLPAAYDDTRPLHFAFQTTETVKVTVVSPDAVSSIFVVKAAENHVGELMMSGLVTSITVEAPAGGATALLTWSMFEIPDLDLAASFRGGVLATGVVS